MPTSTYFTGSIEQRLSDDLHLAGVAERTRKGYLRAVRQLAEHAKCSPDKIDEEAVDRKAAARCHPVRPIFSSKSVLGGLKLNDFSSSSCFRIIFLADEIKTGCDFKSYCAVVPNNPPQQSSQA